MAVRKSSGAGTRQALIKEDSRGEVLETKITSYWSNVGDTNLGKFDVKKFRSSLYTSKPTTTTKKMIKSGIIKASDFPPAVQCYELIVECAKHYDSHTRTIVAPDGRTLAYLLEAAISEAFHLPEPKDMLYRSMKGAKAFYDDDIETCLGIINKYWLLKTRPDKSRIPDRLHRVDFKDEFRDLITLLNRIIGAPQAFYFENWMFFFTETVTHGKGTINWARIISNSLDVQLSRLICPKTFYMSSYIIYSFAKNYEYAGLV